jgi:hypothetical protein
MTKARQHVAAPRIEIMLVPDSDADNLNAESALFDLYLVLHIPDGKLPTTVRADGGPYDRHDAALKLSEMWVQIGEQFAEPMAL